MDCMSITAEDFAIFFGLRRKQSVLVAAVHQDIAPLRTGLRLWRHLNFVEDAGLALVGRQVVVEALLLIQLVIIKATFVHQALAHHDCELPGGLSVLVLLLSHLARKKLLPDCPRGR